MNGYWRARVEMEKREQEETREVFPYRMALLYARLHDADQTVAWLERAYEEHNGRLVFLRVEPVFDAVRKDIRFQNLMQRIGLS